MKKINIILGAFTALSLTIQARGYVLDTISTEPKTVIVSDDEDEVNVLVEDFVKIKDPKDTTEIKIGKKGIKIYNNDKSYSIERKDKSEEEEDDKSSIAKKFKGKYGGINFGMNNYVDNNFSLSRTSENEFLDLHTGKSINVGFNFKVLDIGIIKDRLGFIIGASLDYNNYRFDNDSSIQKLNGNLATKSVQGTVLKSKLTASYFEVPILLQLQLLNEDLPKRLHLTAGIVGGLKLGSHTKTKVKEADDTIKEKERSDFYLNPFKVSMLAMAGYKDFSIYAKYSLTSLFIEDRAPELYPFSMGIAFTISD